MESKKELTEKFQDFFNEDVIVSEDTDRDTAFEDDSFIHVIRNGLGFAFYNGQGKGCYKEKDIPKFIRKVEKVLNKLKM